MTAPIVYYGTQEVRDILRDGPDNNGDTLGLSWRVPGQLWDRVAEGKKRGA